jgi:hypothetical protein
MSSEITTELFVNAWQRLFEELYNGPEDYHSTWITTNEPDASIQGLLKRLTAVQASQILPSGQSIAMHVEHLRWSLALANSYFRNENPQPNWEESWSVLTVDGAQWDQLRADLKTESATLQAAVAARTDWSDAIFFTGTFSFVPHAAYHLGAIVQMTKMVEAQ